MHGIQTRTVRSNASDIDVIALRGRFDSSSYGVLLGAIADSRRRGITRIVIDLSSVTHLDEVEADLLRDPKFSDLKLALAAARPAVHRTLVTYQLIPALPYYSTAKEAISALSEQ